MGPVLTTIRRDGIVRADHRVRRRRYGEQALLVRHVEYVVLDAIADSVWLGCERGDTVGEIVTGVAGRHGLPLHEALAATVAALEHFRALGFVHDDPGAAPEALAEAGP